MEPAERALIEWELTKLNNSFAYCMDHGEFETMIELFTSDAYFDRAGITHRGQDEIRQGMRDRPKVTSRHLLTNFHYFDVTDDSAEAVVYAMVYHGPPQENGKPATYATDNGRLVEFRDTYTRTKEGWRIASRIGEPILMPKNWPMTPSGNELAMADNDIRDVVDRFFDALQAGDQEACRRMFVDDAVVWHNYDRFEQPKDAALAELSGLVALRASFDIVHRDMLADGCVQQHVVRVPLPDGRTAEIAAIQRIYCAAGKITRIEEYMDSVQMAAMRQTIEEALSSTPNLQA